MNDMKIPRAYLVNDIPACIKDNKKRFLSIFDKIVKYTKKDVCVDFRQFDKPSTQNDSIYVNVWSGRKYDDINCEMSGEYEGFTYDADTVIATSCRTHIDNLVEVYSGQINILYNAFMEWNDNELGLFELIINKVLMTFDSEENINKAIEEYDEYLRDIKRNKLIDNIMRSESDKLRDLQNRLEDTEHQYKKFLTRAKNYGLQLSSLRLQLTAVNKSKDEYIEKIKTEFDKIKSNKNIESFDIDDTGYLIVNTHKIYCNVLCEDNVTRKYYFGKYQIRVEIAKGEVKFYNQEKNMLRHSAWGNKCHHPHVSEIGNPCLGNTTTMIVDCCVKLEWAILVDVLINYLQSVNITDSAGKCYVEWDEIDSEGNVIKDEEKKYHNN